MLQLSNMHTVKIHTPIIQILNDNDACLIIHTQTQQQCASFSEVTSSLKHKQSHYEAGDHAGPEHVQAHLHTNYSICKYFMQNNSLTESSVASYVMVLTYVRNKKESVCPGLCATKGSGGGQGVKQTVCVCVCV